jgi:hypothetical protein
MAWTEDEKKKLVEAYLAKKPTPETSTEIIKELAEEFEQSANGVRMVLIQEKVYVKKDAAGAAPASADGKKSSETGAKRVSKESQIAALKEAITAKGCEVDSDILDKLTGKAAAYFTGILTA